MSILPVRVQRAFPIIWNKQEDTNDQLKRKKKNYMQEKGHQW